MCWGLVAGGGREGGEGGEGGPGGGLQGRPGQAGGGGGAGQAGAGQTAQVDGRGRPARLVEGALVLPTLGSSVLEPDLDPGLAQAQLLTQLLAHESIRVVGLVKQTLQCIQLLQTENIKLSH